MFHFDLKRVSVKGVMIEIHFVPKDSFQQNSWMALNLKGFIRREQKCFVKGVEIGSNFWVP